MGQFYRYLKDLGFLLEEKNFASHGWEGWAIELGSSEIIFRVEDAKLLIVYFRRIDTGQTLKSPLKDLEGFVDLIKSSDSGIQQIYGLVSPDLKRERRLSTKRLAKLLHHYGAVTSKVDFGDEWIVLDLKQYHKPGTK